MTIVRGFLALVIWVLDLALKFAVGAVLVRVAWLCIAFPFGFSFSTIWSIASALSGLMIVGFFDSDDIILNGIAKRLMDPNDRTKSGKDGPPHSN